MSISLAVGGCAIQPFGILTATWKLSRKGPAAAPVGWATQSVTAGEAVGLADGLELAVDDAEGVADTKAVTFAER